MHKAKKEKIIKLEKQLNKAEELFNSYQYLDLGEVWDNYLANKRDVLLALNSLKTSGVIKDPRWTSLEEVSLYIYDFAQTTREKILAEVEKFERTSQNLPKKMMREKSEVWAYNIIGVLSSATDEEVKKAYRNKLKLNHPDRLESAEVDEVFTQLAQKRVRELKEAWEYICKIRKIK